jgi:hypothetical protein
MLDLSKLKAGSLILSHYKLVSPRIILKVHSTSQDRILYDALVIGSKRTFFIIFLVTQMIGIM